MLSWMCLAALKSNVSTLSMIFLSKMTMIKRGNLWPSFIASMKAFRTLVMA